MTGGPAAVERRGDTTLVTLRGELDAFTAPALRLELRELVEERGVSTLVVDLGAVTFLDSSALGALVGALRRLREQGGRLHIVRPQTPAARIFELTGLDKVLDIHADLDEALNATSG